MEALLIVANECDWDEKLRQVQFGINNMINSSTGSTLSQLLLGYIPRGEEYIALRDAVQITSRVVEDIVQSREQATARIEKV